MVVPKHESPSGTCSNLHDHQADCWPALSQLHSKQLKEQRCERQCRLISAAVMLLQGSLAPQHTEIYLQLKTEYLKMMPHPLLAAVAGNASTRTWLILQEVLFSLGPEMYWSRRRTLLVVRTMELQTAWLDSICLVSLACLVSQAAVAAGMHSASSKCLSAYVHHSAAVPSDMQDVVESVVVLSVSEVCAFLSL